MSCLFIFSTSPTWRRGIFYNEAQTALAWVNEEDHCRIISMELGGDIPSVFTRFCALSEVTPFFLELLPLKVFRLQFPHIFSSFYPSFLAITLICNSFPSPFLALLRCLPRTRWLSNFL